MKKLPIKQISLLEAPQANIKLTKVNIRLRGGKVKDFFSNINTTLNNGSNLIGQGQTFIDSFTKPQVDVNVGKSTQTLMIGGFVVAVITSLIAIFSFSKK